jgi:glycosyltransferase involved in cell wall biosynthesis
VPLKDEESNIDALINELEPIMQSLGRPWELICIDDGSIDATLPLLEKAALTRPYLRILSFVRNCGQSAAFDAGFKASLGDFIITIDGDLQNDPADIPMLIKLAETTPCDLVCGIRKKRRDPFMKRVISKFANAIRSRFCADGVQDTGCSLKVYRTACLRKIKMFNGMHRFLPALFRIEGFSIAETPVNHRQRQFGKTKYNIFNRSFNTIADMLAVRWMSNRHLKYQIKGPTS